MLSGSFYFAILATSDSFSYFCLLAKSSHLWIQIVHISNPPAPAISFHVLIISILNSLSDSSNIQVISESDSVDCLFVSLLIDWMLNIL